MTTLPEITDLFARLASHLQTLNQTSVTNVVVVEEEEESPLNLSISTLNQSLNLGDDSRVRVLDTALSLMCFKAPKVFNSMIEYLVKTIVSVLSSSITCKVFRFQNEENLQIGSSILRRDCVELIEMCNDAIEKLEGYGRLTTLLLDAVVRVAVSASCYRYLSPVTHILDVKSIDVRSIAVSKLLFHLPAEFSFESQDIPVRLLFWYLDPLSLKHDVSKILQDTTERPFLCLSKEFHEKTDWHNIVICLVLSPVMFIETRALLHNWLLMTGLASILELLVGLVSVIMDIISRPAWWGIPVELASRLPFSNAYFPCKNHLLRTLAGPLSSESFVLLVHATSEPVFHARKHSDLSFKPAAMKVATIDHKSIWALAINFPEWFYFASVLLFSEKSFQENSQLKCKLEAPNNREAHNVEALSAGAARYIAWILSPVSKANQDLLVDFLTKISEAWTLKQFGSGAHDNEAAGYRKKLKKLKFHDKEDFTLSKEYDSKMIEFWLIDFQNICMQHANKAVNGSAPCEANASRGLSLQQDLLIRRIPLGILIGCPNLITEDGCELLLHYAATSRILLSKEIKSAGLTHVKRNSEDKEDLVRQIDKCSKREALAGANLVFSLTDIVESMSASFYETEESGLECIYQVKLKASKYLIKCIKRLIQLNMDDDGVLVLKDLPSRLVHWRHQGQEVSQVNRDLDDVIGSLSHKLSSL